MSPLLFTNVQKFGGPYVVTPFRSALNVLSSHVVAFYFQSARGTRSLCDGPNTCLGLSKIFSIHYGAHGGIWIVVLGLIPEVSRRIMMPVNPLHTFSHLRAKSSSQPTSSWTWVMFSKLGSAMALGIRNMNWFSASRSPVMHLTVCLTDCFPGEALRHQQ